MRIKIKNNLKWSLVLSLAYLISGCGETSNVKETEKLTHPLLGSWEMKSIHWITADTTYTIEKAQPGLLIISPKSYSIMWTPTAEPRVPFEVLSKPTDEELKAGFRSIVFNGGSYEITDSTLTTHAKVAKVPGFEGGKQFYTYQISNGELQLVMFDETYPDGTKPEWFGRYTTKFVFESLE